MLNYLNSVFCDNCREYTLEDINLPIYLKAYIYNGISIFNKKYIFVTPKNCNINRYNNHRNIIEQLYGCESVLVITKVNDIIRNNLINNNIMFVSLDGNVFIPSIGVVFNRENKNVDVESFTILDTLISLGFIYLNKCKLKAKDFELTLGLNRMSVLRTTRKLISRGLIEKETYGNTYLYRIIGSKEDYIDKLLNLMKNPIINTYVINNKYIDDNFYISNISLIASKSSLSNDDISYYAIDKVEVEKYKKYLKPYFKGMILSTDESIVEVWNYKPNLYNNQKESEILSVIKTINTTDERLLFALDEAKEDIINDKENLWAR